MNLKHLSYSFTMATNLQFVPARTKGHENPVLNAGFPAKSQYFFPDFFLTFSGYNYKAIFPDFLQLQHLFFSVQFGEIYRYFLAKGRFDLVFSLQFRIIYRYFFEKRSIWSSESEQFRKIYRYLLYWQNVDLI